MDDSSSCLVVHSYLPFYHDLFLPCLSSTPFALCSRQSTRRRPSRLLDGPPSLSVCRAAVPCLHSFMHICFIPRPWGSFVLSVSAESYCSRRTRLLICFVVLSQSPVCVPSSILHFFHARRRPHFDLRSSPLSHCCFFRTLLCILLFLGHLSSIQLSPKASILITLYHSDSSLILSCQLVRPSTSTVVLLLLLPFDDSYSLLHGHIGESYPHRFGSFSIFVDLSLASARTSYPIVPKPPFTPPNESPEFCAHSFIIVFFWLLLLPPFHRHMSPVPGSVTRSQSFGRRRDARPACSLSSRPCYIHPFFHSCGLSKYIYSVCSFGFYTLCSPFWRRIIYVSSSADLELTPLVRLMITCKCEISPLSDDASRLQPRHRH